MSETEQIAFLKRAEEIICCLEKTKKWYKSAAIAFAVAFCVFVSASGVVTYRVNDLGKEIDTKAPLKTVELLKQSNEAYTEALIELIDKQYKDAVKEFNEKCKVINENIFMFTTTRGAKTSIK
jgi:Mg2+ and Co2+ transporter CorA